MTRAQLFLIEPFVLVLLFGVGWVFAPHLRRVLTSLDRQSIQRIGLGIIAVAWAWPWCFGSPTHGVHGFLEARTAASAGGTRGKGQVGN